MNIGSLFVIVKIVERCNLACSYCYYYAPDNAEVYERDRIMKPERLGELLHYIAEASTSTGLRRVVFAFHGGEPTLAKAAYVRAFCDKAKLLLGSQMEVRFALQTNAVHLSQDWLNLIEQECMGVGVSIDGPRSAHDLNRVDHQGRGSYDRVAANLSRLLAVERRQPRVRITALSVMGPDFEGISYYKHLVDDLGMRYIKLLFEDRTNDSPLSAKENEALSQQLCDIFDHWLAYDAGTVSVIPFDSIVRGTVRRLSSRPSLSTSFDLGLAVLSDGRVRMPDDFMTAKSWYWSQPELTLSESTFGQFLATTHFGELQQGVASIPSACTDCEFASVCRGGEVPHRFRTGSGFDNRSVYCVALMALHAHIRFRLTSHGSPVVDGRLQATQVFA